MADKKEKALGYLKAKHHVAFHGDPSTGKTELALEIAREQGWKVIKINASDSRTKETLEQYFRLMRTKAVTRVIGKKRIGKLVFLLDEVDGFHDWKFLQLMLFNSQHPIILTANDLWKIPQWVFKNPKTKRSMVRTMKFYPPTQDKIVTILRAKGIDGNFAGITRDLRSAEHILKFGSSAEVERNQFDQIKYMINNPEVILEMAKNKSSWKFFEEWNNWLLHNLPIFLRGYPLFEALELMSMADMYRKPEILQFLPVPIVGGKGQEPEYPEYLKTLKKYRYNKRKNSA